MKLWKMASVLVALGCAVCLGQQEPGAASQTMFAKSDSAKGGKVSRPPDCPAKFDDSLETNGVAPERARGVKQPKPVYTPEAEFSEKTRKEINRKHLRPFFSVSLLSFVVDTDGHTRDVCVKRPGQFDSDEQAARAVMQWRFEPATKDGEPVAMRISTEISFSIR